MGKKDPRGLLAGEQHNDNHVLHKKLRVVAYHWWLGGWGVTANGCEVSFGANKNNLKLDYGDACATLVNILKTHWIIL